MRAFFLVLLSFVVVGFAKAQTDTTSGNDYFLTFVKKVYLNPTVYLRTTDFKERTNIGFVALPDLASSQNNASSGFEKGLQKLLRLLMQTDGGIRFYFNPDNATAPFTFWCTDNLWCKFKQPEKDSIQYYLNNAFSDSNIDLSNNQRFESTIDNTLDYIERVLAANPGECGDQPQNETTTINTKPLAINVHNTSTSKYDIDYKNYERLASNYAVAFDEFTQQEWFAPSKMFVTGDGAEPLTMSIDLHDPQFKKENLKIEILKTHTVLAHTYSNDSVRFSLPANLSPSDPMEIIVKYKSQVDSVNYTVGLFMVNVVEEQQPKLVLLGANGYVVSSTDVSNVQTYLNKVYKPVGVAFDVSSDSYVFPNDYPTLIVDEGTDLLSNYPNDLHDYVGEVKDLETYDNETYYLVLGLNNNTLRGYMPRARNIGFIFFPENQTSYLPSTVAHELGHGAFHFRHIFDEEELGEESIGGTHNIMDYSNVVVKEALYLHQWNFIQDPAFVSWFNGDEDDATLPIAVSYRCLPTSLMKKYEIESYLNTSGNVVQLNASQKPYAFTGSETEYSGRLLMINQSNKYYYACQRNEEYPGYYPKISPDKNGLNTDIELTLGTNQSVEATRIIIDDKCNYSIKRPNEPIIIGKTDSCECSSNAPKPIVSNYDYVLGPLPEDNNQTYTGVPSGFSCDKFVLSTGKFAKLPSEIVPSITSFQLTSDSRLHSFTIDGKNYINAIWGARKKNTTGLFEVAGGSEYFICFDDVDAAIVNSTGYYFNGSQIFYENISLTSSMVKKIKDSDISFYVVGEQAIQILDNGSIGCDEAPMTLSILENSILNCRLSACMSGLYDYLTYENLKLFKTVTQDHLLEYMFRNVIVEHPFNEEPYGYLNITNANGKYVLMDLIKAFEDTGRLDWFIETFLLQKNNVGNINLQKIAVGQNDINLKCEFSNFLFNYLNKPNAKKYYSPKVAIKDKTGQAIQFPASVNTVIPYYENWFQTSNTFVVKSDKCNVVVKADEFDFHYENGLIKIEQNGTYNIFKNYPATDPANHTTQTSEWSYQVLSKLVDEGVDFDAFINNEKYDDAYDLHPYDFVEITLGKAIPELGLKEGQTLAFPAFFVSVLGQFGQDKVSAQNFTIFVGVVALATAVFTGGASLVTLSTTASTMTVTAFTGEVLTIGLGLTTTGFDIASLYFTATDGNQNLTPEQLKTRETVAKVAMYLNMLEIGIGGFSVLRRLVKVGGLTDVASSLLNKVDDLGLTGLKAEINLLDEVTKAKFLDEFAGASDEALQALNSNPALLNYWKTNGDLIKSRIYPNVGNKVWSETKAVITTKADPTELKILNGIETAHAAKPLTNNKPVMAGAYCDEIGGEVAVKYNLTPAEKASFNYDNLDPIIKDHIDYLNFIRNDAVNGGTLYQKLYKGVSKDKVIAAGDAASHAEILAMDEIIKKMRAANKFNSQADLSKIKILVKGKGEWGNMCRCPHCYQLSVGVKMIGNE